MIKYLIIGMLGLSMSVVASDPIYKVTKDVYVRRTYDLSNDSYSYKLTQGDWTGMFSLKLEENHETYEYLKTMNLIPLGHWHNTKENWRIILCKYKNPTKEKTRCIVHNPFKNSTVANSTIIVDFVVEKDLPKVVEKDIIVPVKKVQEAEAKAPIKRTSFDQEFNTFFETNMDK